MPQTLEHARRQLRLMLGEAGAIRYSNADLNDWLDEGQKLVAALLLSYHRRAVVTNADSPQPFTPLVREYHASSPIGAGGLGLTDIIKPLHVWLNNDSLMLWEVDMVGNAAPRSTTAGTPQFWYWFADHLGLVPSPDATFLASTFTVEVVYAARPSDWTSGASVLPEGHDELPVYYALLLAHLRRGRVQAALTTLQLFITLVNRYSVLHRTLNPAALADLRRPVATERLDRQRGLATQGDRR